MDVFIITFVFFLIVVAAMSVGFIVQRKSISGSCGGLGAVGIEKACDCDQPCDKRKKRLEDERAQRREQWQKNRII